LASPRTGLAPAGCRELVARLRHGVVSFLTAPELLDAHRLNWPFLELAGLVGISNTRREAFRSGSMAVVITTDPHLPVTIANETLSPWPYYGAGIATLSAERARSLYAALAQALATDLVTGAQRPS